ATMLRMVAPKMRQKGDTPSSPLAVGWQAEAALRKTSAVRSGASGADWGSGCWLRSSAMAWASGVGGGTAGGGNAPAGGAACREPTGKGKGKAKGAPGGRPAGCLLFPVGYTRRPRYHLAATRLLG